MNSGAYTSEIVRGGIELVAHGQIEAAAAYGMSRWMRLRRVAVPQALRQLLPAYGNECISIVKASSLASTITLMDVTGVARNLASKTYTPIETYVAAGLIYLALNFLIAQALGKAEEKAGATRAEALGRLDSGKTMAVESTLKIRQIEAFKAVVETGSVTAAALKLSLTQPAVSKLIAHLERSVGMRLFERTRGRLRNSGGGDFLRARIANVRDTGEPAVGSQGDQVTEARQGDGGVPAIAVQFVASAAMCFFRQRQAGRELFDTDSGLDANPGMGRKRSGRHRPRHGSRRSAR